MESAIYNTVAIAEKILKKIDEKFPEHAAPFQRLHSFALVNVYNNLGNLLFAQSYLQRSE